MANINPKGGLIRTNAQIMQDEMGMGAVVAVAVDVGGDEEDDEGGENGAAGDGKDEEGEKDASEPNQKTEFWKQVLGVRFGNWRARFEKMEPYLLRSKQLERGPKYVGPRRFAKPGGRPMACWFTEFLEDFMQVDEKKQLLWRIKSKALVMGKLGAAMKSDKALRCRILP